MGGDITNARYMVLGMHATVNGCRHAFLVNLVDHFEAEGKYTRAIMCDCKTTHLVDANIGLVALFLPGNHLDRCHKCTILNLHKIDSLLPSITPKAMTQISAIMNISPHEMPRLKYLMSCYDDRVGVKRR